MYWRSLLPAQQHEHSFDVKRKNRDIPNDRADSIPDNQDSIRAQIEQRTNALLASHYLSLHHCCFLFISETTGAGVSIYFDTLLASIRDLLVYEDPP